MRSSEAPDTTSLVTLTVGAGAAMVRADAGRAQTLAGWGRPAPGRMEVTRAETVQEATTVAPTPKSRELLAPCAGTEARETITTGIVTATIRMELPSRMANRYAQWRRQDSDISQRGR